MNIKQLASDISKQMQDSELRLVAGSLAYSTVLSLVPFFALTLTIFQVFGGLEFLEPKVQQILLQYFREAVGSEATLILRKILDRLKPGTVGISSALFLLFTSHLLLQDIQNGINRMWKKNTKRTWHARILTSWFLLSAFTLFLAAYTGFRSLDFVKPILKTQKELLDLGVLGLTLFLLYKFLPQAKVRWQSAAISAFFAGLGLLALQSSFASITKSFFQFSRIYGSIVTIPLLLTWVLFLWYVILAGAALTAALDKSHDAAMHKMQS